MIQRLELTWIGKHSQPRLEPRIILEDTSLAYHADARVSSSDCFDNSLIFGDNLLALKALEQELSGKIKCAFIDPPYNTGNEFTQYSDGVEHSQWLSMVRDRVSLLHKLISVDGSLWMTIDDNEGHYLKVLCDEIFGRQNFVANVVWQKNFSAKAAAKYLSISHDHVLVYAKEIGQWKRNLLPRSAELNKMYKNPDGDPRGPWTSGDLSARNYYSLGTYKVTTPAGRVIEGPPRGTYWRVSHEKFISLDADNRIWWGSDRNNQPRLKRFLSEVQDGITPQTLWLQSEVGNTQEAKKEVMVVVPDASVFATPKPERLLARILEIATNEGDLIIDSFAGSGTSGAVAHKMGRRWIMIELGEHCHTHIIPRLKKVIDGTDQGGISKAVGWKGGGGFRYYKLAPSLLKKDKHGQWVVNEAYNAEMLAEAMCKHMGFQYAPSDEIFWMHGRSTETDFIYVTTQTLTEDALAHLSEEVGESRSLLICCAAWRGNLDHYPNLSLSKIPNAILTRCEFGHDDYSLQVENLPQRPPEPEPPVPGRRGVQDTETPDLFADESQEEEQ